MFDGSQFTAMTPVVYPSVGVDRQVGASRATVPVAQSSLSVAAGLTAILRELSAEGAGHDCAALSVVVEGRPRAVHPTLGDEVYRIACEALRNAFRHAQAKQIEVELHYGDRELRLRVRDDGKGIDPKFLSAQGREAHFGLHGMRERAKLMGGKLNVWSALDSGTEVELSIPAAHAYTSSLSRRRSWLAERFSTLRARVSPR